MTKEDKEIYENKVCKFCSNCDFCNKDKFKVIKLNDKTTYRCYDYNYKDYK